MVSKTKHIHFIGIGGTGMSGLAQVYHQLGYQVTGSDPATNTMVQRLSQMGITIYKEHLARNVERADLIVYSSAIAETNPEIMEARKRNLPIWHRSQLLLDLMNTRQVIAVAGTHGKTTTSSMIFSMLLDSGMQPTAVIGGRVKEISSGATLGEGPWLVAEADESDGSFLQYKPQVAVINNIEADHLEHYDGKVENIVEAFREFMNHVLEGGWVIFGIDDPNTYQLQKECRQKNITYGFHKEAQVFANNIVLENLTSTCDIYYRGEKLGKLVLQMPGLHNIQNALASVAVGIALEIPFDKLKIGLETFLGVDRRFQTLGEVNGIRIVDDYAHNPAKVAAAISAAGTGGYKRVIAVFQPHRYSRTRFLAEEFGNSFDKADLTILTEIYPAGEEPLEGVSSQNIFDAAKRHGYLHMIYIPKREKVLSYLLPVLEKGDIVMFMGAGDIWKLGEELLSKLKEKYPVIQDGNEILKIDGKIEYQVPLKRYTTIRVGGNAEIFITAESIADLEAVCRYAQKNKIDLFVLGGGSNLLIRDGGIKGMVLKLGKKFNYKEVIQDTKIRCGAATLLPQVARFAAENGLSGLEELVGIPASVGGAVVMNSGAHGRQIADVLTTIKGITFDGERMELSPKDIEFGYHSSNLHNLIVYEIIFSLHPDSPERIKKKIQEYLEMRNASQPMNQPSAGCVFRNPINGNAGKLIDQCGLKESTVGGAMISPKHANFFVNIGNATALNFLQLIELARTKVKEKHHIDLDLEVKILGQDDSEYLQEVLCKK